MARGAIGRFLSRPEDPLSNPGFQYLITEQLKKRLIAREQVGPELLIRPIERVKDRLCLGRMSFDKRKPRPVESLYALAWLLRQFHLLHNMIDVPLGHFVDKGKH